MGKFEIRPPMVEAHQVPMTAETHDWVSVAGWCDGRVVIQEKSGFHDHIALKTLGDTDAKAYPGDWIVTHGSATGFWICSNEAFNKTYREAVDG